jgi:hypothetical protein
VAGETWVSRTRRQAGETRRADATAVDLQADTHGEERTEAEAGEDGAEVAVAADNAVDDPVGECTLAEFTLFVTGDSEISRRALVGLRKLCDERLRIPATMLIIDTAREPAIAELNGVSRTPTLVKHGPGPTRRFSGDLSSTCAVMACLEFPESCVRSDAPLIAAIPARGDAAAG